MYEYKVDIYKVKYAEDAMNTFAEEGWRVIAVTPDHNSGFVDVFYERLKRSASYRFIYDSKNKGEMGSEGESLTEIVRNDITEDAEETKDADDNGTEETAESEDPEE